jgi:rhodanese-related sulfurtransferase
MLAEVPLAGLSFGYRSAIGASLLQKLGHGRVHDLVGGYKAWLATKAPATATA